MHDRGAGARDRGGEAERARDQAREHADPAFLAAFAADLEMHQVETARERRAEEQVEVRGDAADHAAVGAQHQNARRFHAALRRAAITGCPPSSALRPSAP